MARRKGHDWYLAGIAGDTASNVALSLSFLRTGVNYEMTLIADGASSSTFNEKNVTVKSNESITINMKLRGGFVARLVDTNPLEAHGCATHASNKLNSASRTIYLLTGERLQFADIGSGTKTKIAIFSLDGCLKNSLLLIQEL